MLPHKIKLNTEKINDKAFNKIGAFIFSAFALLGLIDGFVSGSLSFYKIILLILIIIGLAIISFNLIAGKTLKVIISFGLILLLIFHSVSLLVATPAIDNFGKLYLILSIFILGLLYLAIMFTHKILTFELINKTENDNILFSKAIKQLRKFFFVLFLFFLSISINWFIVDVKYHTVLITSLSLVSLFTYIYLRVDKSDNSIKIIKAIITTLPLILITFTWDYISWRWFVFNKLSSIDKSVGLIDPQTFTLGQSVLINVGFNLISIILIILLAKTIINCWGCFKLRKNLYENIKAKKQKIILDPKEYSFLWYFYALFLFQIMVFIGGYVLILIFIVIGYYLLLKKKILSFKCYGKELKENVITEYLRGHSVIVWKIIIPLLIISYLSAALTATPFLITLISKSLN